MAFLIILYNPIFMNPENFNSSLSKLCFLLSTLEKKQRFEFALFVQESILSSTLKKEEQSHLFQQIIALLQQFLTLSIVSSDQNSPIFDEGMDDASIWAIQSLGLFGKQY